MHETIPDNLENRQRVEMMTKEERCREWVQYFEELEKFGLSYGTSDLVRKALELKLPIPGTPEWEEERQELARLEDASRNKDPSNKEKGPETEQSRARSDPENKTADRGPANTPGP